MTARRMLVFVASTATVLSAAVVATPAAEAKAPPRVVTARVSVTADAAVLTWHNPRSKAFRGTVVRIAAGSRAPKSVTAGRGVGTVGRKCHTVTVGRLAPGTIYTASLFSVDTRHRYSTPVAIRIQTAPSAVSGLTALATSSTMRFYWRSSPSRSASGVIVRYLPGSQPPDAITAGFPLAAPGRTTTAYLAGGLRPRSPYAVSVWARDAAGHVSPRRSAVFATTAATAGGISGVVTGGASGKRLRGVRVDFYRYDGAGKSDGSGVTYTQPDGTYRFGSLAPGSYEVDFDADAATGGDSQAGYLDSYVSDVVVSAGDPVAVSASLDAGAGFSGTVLADGSGEPVADAAVTTNSADDESAYDRTDAAGRYTVIEAPGSTDQVCIADRAGVDDTGTGYLEQCSYVRAVPGTIVPLADVHLVAGGAVTGDVELDGASGATVRVYDRSGQVADTDWVGADGDVGAAYKLSALAPGDSYVVCAESADEAYGSVCFDATSGAGVRWDGVADHIPFADLGPVTVAPGETTGSVDLELPRG